MIDDLLLISGNDIPFVQAQIIIHQPTLKEIAYITEETFWTGYEVLKFDKQILEYNNQLSQFSNFQLILSLLNDKTEESQKTRISVFSILSILFPKYKISLQGAIKLEDIETHEVKEINNNNFIIFKNILKDMFCLTTDNKQYNPSGNLAKKIANKIKKGYRKKAQLESKNEKISFFSRYISIVATIKNKSIKEIMDYTIYQLMDQFNRFMLYKANQQWFAMKIAGATGLKDPEDWLKDIHS